MTEPRLTKYWTLRHGLVATALGAAGVLATLQAWRDIVHIAARDEEASHILLVPIVFVWLLWVRRARLRRIHPSGHWIGPALVLLGWVLYDVGDSSLWQSVWHAGALLVVVGCVLTVFGRELLMRALPAFFVLLFAIPVPGRIRQQIALPLQTATAEVTQQVFETLGMPVERSGNQLSINGKHVAIAEACNGMRMTFALGLVSYAFAFGNPLRTWVRVIIVALSPIFAILCNVVRLLPTVWVYGHLSDARGDQFHNISGWIMLFVAFLMLMGVLRLMRWALIPVTRFTLAYD